MIKKIAVKNFRSLKDVIIDFEEDITVLVGENDSGKTSVVDVLKILFDNKSVEIDDFSYGKDEIYIEVDTINGSFIKKFWNKDEQNIDSETNAKFSKGDLSDLKNLLDSDEFDSLTDEGKRKKLEEIARRLGVSFRSNIRSDTLKAKILERIEVLLKENNKEILIESNIHDYNVYFLDGKHFEDISKFFQEMFFKDKRKSIWSEKIGEEKTIEEVIRERLEEYSEGIKSEIEKRGIKDKLKDFLPELTEVFVEPIFEPRDINIGVKVKLLEGEDEIPINKKGDGTKRRITMALLEYKKTQQEAPSLYVFDEPDTHLHVKAQMELLSILRQFCENRKQIIITTHSPFIMNSVKPKQIRLLSLENGETKIKRISSDKQLERVLMNLGIENIYLFFSRKILIVEGETDERFITIIYERLFGDSLHSNLIKVIKRDGITDVPRFAQVLSQFVKPEDILILVDGDIDERKDKTKEIIGQLEIPEENIFKVGTKEFEDAFEPEVLYNAWKKFVENRGKDIGEKWTIENINELRKKCICEGLKFSEELRSLNTGCGVSMDKPKLGQALAEFCEDENLPEDIKSLLERLRED